MNDQWESHIKTAGHLHDVPLDDCWHPSMGCIGPLMQMCLDHLYSGPDLVLQHVSLREQLAWPGRLEDFKMQPWTFFSADRMAQRAGN